MWSRKPVLAEISGLQKNWKEHFPPLTWTQCSSTTPGPSHLDSSDEFDHKNNQVALKVQAIQEKQQTSTAKQVKEITNGTKMVCFMYWFHDVSLNLKPSRNTLVRDKAPQSSL